jgi:hypothetical protein
MADHIREQIENQGRRAAEACREVGRRIAAATDGKTHPRGYSPARVAADVRPGMGVIAGDGTRVGTVDHLDGTAIKLARHDSPDGEHHWVPLGWVARVDGHVRLTKPAADARRDWQDDAPTGA